MNTIQFYGTRGSAPLSGEEYLEYGGATTCVLLRFDSASLMIDCGSGAGNAVADLKDLDELHLFISHPHLDHISGIVSLVPLFVGKKQLHIYGTTYAGVSIREHLCRVMSEPLWPISLDHFNVVFHDLDEVISIGDVTVTHMESNHPGGCTLFRLEDSRSSVVTAFDFNHADGFDQKLISFAHQADTMIYDGMFSEEEYAEKSDWGHSTVEKGMEIARAAQVKNLYITHFAAKTDDELSALEDEYHKIDPSLHFAKCGMQKNKFLKMLEVGALLTAEKDNNRLLNDIVRAAMDITGADAGTLYLLRDNVLVFRIMITRSKNFYRGIHGEPIDLPPVQLSRSNVCAAAVLEERTINIPDVYHSEAYDFSGPKNYDKLNQYKTTSALVVPMKNDYGEIIGVIQLINATDEQNQIVSFSPADEAIIEAIAAQAAITITNVNYAKQINDLLFGFVRVMSTGIDARTPYNANHTKNMVKYTDRFLDVQEEIHGPYALSEEERKELLISIWLHDIGKLITPLEVMDKRDRLGPLMESVRNRFGRIDLLQRIDAAGGRLTEEVFLRKQEELKDDLAFIRDINPAGFLSDANLERVQSIAKKTFVEIDGTECPYLTEEELSKLSIRKGTLTQEERQVMESHVVMTSKMLSELDFPRGFKEVPFLAGSHHEHLNGKGYPNHLSADALPWKARFITIVDVFEALTAKDRPYKPPMPTEKALAILDDMVRSGQIDPDLLRCFKESKAWE